MEIPKCSAQEPSDGGEEELQSHATWNVQLETFHCHVTALEESNLVGGIPTPLKNDGVKVSWDDVPFPTEWEVIKFHGSSMFQSPPTRYIVINHRLTIEKCSSHHHSSHQPLISQESLGRTTEVQKPQLSQTLGDFLGTHGC